MLQQFGKNDRRILMKVVIEIENDEDMKRVERFLKFLQPSIMKPYLDKANKVKDFIDFIDNEATQVSRVIIPGREERHAR
jgi:hypothetical protein